MFLQNTPILWDVVPRADALGWYALPRWGKWNDDVSDPAFDRCGLGAKETEGDALGWYALPRWGKWNDDVFVRVSDIELRFFGFTAIFPTNAFWFLRASRY